jgi:hypothetical protein
LLQAKCFSFRYLVADGMLVMEEGGGLIGEGGVVWGGTTVSYKFLPINQGWVPKRFIEKHVLL